MRFKLFPSKNGWRVRILWRNGRIFATSEAYDTKYNAERAAFRAARLLSASLPSEILVG